MLDAPYRVGRLARAHHAQLAGARLEYLWLLERTDLRGDRVASGTGLDKGDLLEAKLFLLPEVVPNRTDVREGDPDEQPDDQKSLEQRPIPAYGGAPGGPRQIWGTPLVAGLLPMPSHGSG